MDSGIAILRHDSVYTSPEETIKILQPLPLSFLAYEMQDCTLIAQALELEKIRIVTIAPTDQISKITNSLRDIIAIEKPSRIYFRLFSEGLDAGPTLEILASTAKDVDRIGFISPIGEMYREGSATRQILGFGMKRFEYVPIVNYTKKNITDSIQAIRIYNGKDCMAFVLPMSAQDDVLGSFILYNLVQNGVTEICLPSLSHASRVNLFMKENDMVTKRKPTTKRKPKEILMPPEGEKAAVKVKCLFPIAKRSTPSLNAMVLGSCEIGEELDIVSIHKINDRLCFGEAKQGFYVCMTSNGIDYTEYL
jgi:hypothetical protein